MQGVSSQQSLVTPRDAGKAEPDRLVEKENIRAFIAKKREIFFVQLSLDIKREEMARLKERAQQACRLSDNCAHAQDSC